MITSDGDVGCTIKMVTVRRKSDGANGTDVSGAFFNNLTEDEQSLVRAAHNRAHRLN